MTGSGSGTLRVSFVADSETWGGAEVYLTHLARCAPMLGWDPFLVAAEPVAPALSRAFPEGHTHVVPLSRSAAKAPATAEALGRQKPDVVLVNLVDPASNTAAVAAALDVTATAATLHLGGDLDAGPGRTRLRQVYRRLCALLAPAEWIGEQAWRTLGVSRERTHVIPNGVCVPVDPHGPARADPLRVGVHARLTEQKGLDVLVEATRLLVDARVPLEVVIGGEGGDREALERAARGLPVRFTGFVRDARAFLRDLDVFCLSSRREALPLSLLEAMAEGLPCVSTDVGDVQAVLGNAVLVVPPEDPARLAGAVRRLVEEPLYRERMGALARRRAEGQLDAGVMARQTYDVLASLAAHEHRGHLHDARRLPRVDRRHDEEGDLRWARTLKQPWCG